MADVPPSDEESEPTTITEGDFEREYDVDAEVAGRFLVELGEDLLEGDEVVVSGDDWELPFTFEEPIELDVELEGGDEPELEIEIELDGRTLDVADDHTDRAVEAAAEAAVEAATDRSDDDGE